MAASVDKPRKEEAARKLGGVYGESAGLLFFRSGFWRSWRRQAVCFMSQDGAIGAALTNNLSCFAVFGSCERKAALSRNAVQIGVNLDQCDRHIVMLISPWVGHGTEISDRGGKFR